MSNLPNEGQRLEETVPSRLQIAFAVVYAIAFFLLIPIVQKLPLPRPLASIASLGMLSCAALAGFAAYRFGARQHHQIARLLVTSTMTIGGTALLTSLPSLLSAPASFIFFFGFRGAEVFAGIVVWTSFVLTIEKIVSGLARLRSPETHNGPGRIEAAMFWSGCVGLCIAPLKWIGDFLETILGTISFTT